MKSQPLSQRSRFAWTGPDKYPDHRVGNALANSARIGPDTGGGWTEVLQNLENALPAQQFAGPHGSGGYCAPPLCPHA